MAARGGRLPSPPGPAGRGGRCPARRTGRRRWRSPGTAPSSPSPTPSSSPPSSGVRQGSMGRGRTHPGGDRSVAPRVIPGSMLVRACAGGRQVSVIAPFPPPPPEPQPLCPGASIQGPPVSFPYPCPRPPPPALRHPSQQVRAGGPGGQPAGVRDRQHNPPEGRRVPPLRLGRHRHPAQGDPFLPGNHPRRRRAWEPPPPLYMSGRTRLAPPPPLGLGSFHPKVPPEAKHGGPGAAGQTAVRPPCPGEGDRCGCRGRVRNHLTSGVRRLGRPPPPPPPTLRPFLVAVQQGRLFGLRPVGFIPPLESSFPGALPVGGSARRTPPPPGAGPSGRRSETR